MKKLLEIAIQAALAGGVEILDIYETDFKVETKGDESPLTLADKNANDKIIASLLTTNIPIISEENKQISYAVRQNWSQCWIVDPLDGTKEFIKRNGEFTVNIALVSHGDPILGVIYVPVTKTLYFTAADAKSSKKIILESEDMALADILVQAENIQPTSSTGLTRVVGSRSHLNEDTRNFISELEKKGNIEIVSKGSSLKFCLVAEGEADIYPRFAPTMEWDTAAGDAICRAVGLRVIDQSTGEPLKYNKENLLNPYFLVTNHDK